MVQKKKKDKAINKAQEKNKWIYSLCKAKTSKPPPKKLPCTQ